METCYKMVRTDLLKSIPLESRDFRIEPELAIKLAKRNARIFEVPISYSGRTYQEGKKANWRDGLLAMGAILRFAISDDICKQERQRDPGPATPSAAVHALDGWYGSISRRRPRVGNRCGDRKPY